MRESHKAQMDAILEKYNSLLAQASRPSQLLLHIYPGVTLNLTFLENPS